MHEGSKKAILAAFVANLGIAIAKFVGFLLTRSTGLLAEAAHSLADTGNQTLLMFGSKKASRSPNRRSPFGYGRERYFWAFVVALVLFSMGGLFALYEGIQKVRHPHETKNLGIAIANLINTFNFPLYLLSGGMLPAWDYFAPAMLEEVSRRSFTFRNSETRIEKAKLGNLAGLYGAAYLPLQNQTLHSR